MDCEIRLSMTAVARVDKSGWDVSWSQYLYATNSSGNPFNGGTSHAYGSCSGIGTFNAWAGSYNFPSGHGAGYTVSTGSGSFFIPVGWGTAGNYTITSIAASFDDSGTVLGDSGFSGQTYALPRITQIPAAPTAGAIDLITNTSVRYNATPGDNGGSAITSREVQYSTSSSFASGNTTLTPASLTNVALSGLTPRTRYYVRSREINAVGNGTWSTTTQFDTVDAPDAPTLAVGAKTTTTIAVTLTDPAYTGGGITARQTQIATGPGFSTVLATDTTTTPAFASLTRATPYYIRSRVQNATGWSAWSTTLQVITNVDLPSAPTGYSTSDLASTTTYVGGGAVADNGGGTINNLRVEYNTTASSSGSTVVTVGSNASAFLSGLTAGTLHYARMAVANSGDGGGWGAYGSWVSFTTKGNVPTPPQGLAAGSITDTTATLSWTAPASQNGATNTGYTLRVATDPTFSTGLQVFSLGTAVLSKLASGLLKGTTHYAQVWQNSNNGVGSFSPVISFLTTGVPEVPTSIWMRIAGVWEAGTLWQKIGGVWKQGELWQKISGTWRH